MTEDKITGKYFKQRKDGTRLYRFAVPGDKDVRPTHKIRQEPTGVLYDEAIDVSGGKYTYYETDVEIEYEEDV